MSLKNKILSESKVISFEKPKGNLIILIGGSGSGKSYVRSNLININAKVLDSDKYLTQIANQKNVDLKNPKAVSDLYAETKPRFQKYINNFAKYASTKDNIIIDSTGKDYEKNKKLILLFKEKGYDITIIYVDVDLKTALERNRNRERVIPDEIVKAIHFNIRANIKMFLNICDHMWIVKNETGVNFREGNNVLKLK